MRDYKEVILQWGKNKRKLKGKIELLYDFFHQGLINTKVPYKVYFGGNDHAISFIMGGIYLIAYTCGGEARGIYILQDKIHEGLGDSIKQELVKTTKNDEKKLYWLFTEDIDNLKYINKNKKIWDSYSNASIIINNTKHGDFTRSDFIRNKELLTDFYNYEDKNYVSKDNVLNEFERSLKYSKSLSSECRKERLKNANKKPSKMNVKTEVYLRNPDVVAEVLQRANGICEICKCKAPFVRKSDGTPYLEVHHIVPLSENGEDSCENALALCPNCHRYQHFGKKEE